MKKVISCSRRTDIPAFFLDWLLLGLTEGKVTIKHPFTKQWREITLDPKEIHSIVLWSKDFEKVIQKWDELTSFIKDRFGKPKLYFQFTINSFFPLLEPGIEKSLEQRIEQAKIIASFTSPLHINWRFDPIVFWLENGEIVNNLRDFDYLLAELSSIGIKKCTFSFATWYGKCIRRAKKRKFEFINPSVDKKIEIIDQLLKKTKEYDLELNNCCNSEIASSIIKNQGCIDGSFLSKLFGERASFAKDTGQREQCKCTKSTDIGCYTQICKHNCIYCYARP